MSSKAKWLMATLAGALWLGWLVTYSASKMMMDVGWTHVVATELIRSAAMVATIVCFLLWLVAPIIATAKVWRQIGIEEQRRQCDSCPHMAKRAARYNNIIPTDFTGSIRTIRDGVRNRDN